MIQMIRQAKDDLAANGLPILLVHTSGLHAAGMPGRVNSPISAREVRIVEECTGDLARTQQTFLIPPSGTVDQKVPQACDDPEVSSHFNQPITTYSRIEIFEMVEKHSGIELAIF
jgi:hypothetical protein